METCANLGIYLQPFKINIHDITSIKLSKELALKRKVITVYTKREQYHFYMNAADSVYLILDKKIKKDVDGKRAKN